MGTYVYGLRKNTIQHKEYGEVGVLYFLHKPASWRDPKGERVDMMREGKVRALWKNKDVPKVVILESDPTQFYHYSGGALWCDAYQSLLTPINQ